MAVLKQPEQKSLIAMLEKIRGNISVQGRPKAREVSLTGI